ncbi:MAG: phage integrase SAM-like domain-containing protein, partial [Sporocytophaga sp.]|uniref:phage integrase SAM-like domain and Arm DNA-binding domain-containing protein n=1 Tax=Sporocytophaga sp. TaxID=2231183 RepID=UPI001B26291E
MAQPVRVIAKKDKINKAGFIPLYLRIIVKRQSLFIGLGYSVRGEDWDITTSRIKKSYPNFKQLNALLAKKISDAEALLLESEMKFGKVILTYVKEKLKGKTYTDFFAYAEGQIRKETGKAKISTINNYNSSIAKLRLFHTNKNLKFDEITVEYLEKYEKFLREKLNNKVNTIHNNIKFIRKWFKQAIKDKLITSEEDPFIRFKLKKEKGTKTALTEDEIRKIENISFNDDTRIHDVRLLFLFCYYA